MYRFNVWLRTHPWLIDLVLIAVVTVLPGSWFMPDIGRPGWVQVVVYAATILPILARRRYPIGAATVVLTVAWVQYFGAVWDYEIPIGDLAVELMVYNLAVHGHRRAGAVATAAAAGFYLASVFSRTNHAKAPGVLFGITAMLAIAWLAGEFMRARRALFAEVERRAELAGSERVALARAAVAEDRNRIARELHDVLAHSVSVMVVNAEGASLMRHTDPAVVDRTLKTISTTGRAALVELRRLLEVLPIDPADRRPQPTMAQLGDLVAQARAGSPIGLSVTGDPESLPPSAALQVYRIVQEALTNVVKHAAPTACAHVRVDVGDDGWVRIEVTNAGGGPVSGLPASGRGLAGMRERVAMFDGTLEAGPTGDGRFRLVAIFQVYEEKPAAVRS